MDIILIIFKRIFSVAFIQKAVTQGIPILYGASGEIITERSGNLNLGIPGIMYLGAVGGLTGAFIYEQSAAAPNGWIGVLCAIILAVLFSLAGGLIYSVLTITFRVNQNVTGLALTTFGVGFGNFLGGSLSRISGTAGQVHHTTASTSYYATFQVESGDRMELEVSGPEYGQLVEGDRGKLSFQGTRYLGFNRI